MLIALEHLEYIEIKDFWVHDEYAEIGDDNIFYDESIDNDDFGPIITGEEVEKYHAKILIKDKFKKEIKNKNGKMESQENTSEEKNEINSLIVVDPRDEDEKCKLVINEDYKSAKNMQSNFRTNTLIAIIKDDKTGIHSPNH